LRRRRRTTVDVPGEDVPELISPTGHVVCQSLSLSYSFFFSVTKKKLVVVVDVVVVVVADGLVFCARVFVCVCLSLISAIEKRYFLGFQSELQQKNKKRRKAPQKQTNARYKEEQRRRRRRRRRRRWRRKKPLPILSR
jgi:hypothetical protein